MSLRGGRSWSRPPPDVNDPAIEDLSLTPESGHRTRRSPRQHDLPERGVGFHPLVRLADVAEGEGRVDDGPDAARGEQGDHRAGELARQGDLLLQRPAAQ